MSGATRERVTRSGIAAVATILLTSSLASAHGGDTNTIHACVIPSSGTIRIVDATESCSKNERALDWAKGNTAGATYSAGSGLALSATNEFSVTGAPWSGLTGVPTGFADGEDDNGAGQVAALRTELSDGGIVGGTAGWIRDGSISAADLAGSYAGGNEVVVGAVTSEKIMDGTIQARDIGFGAITTSRQTSNVAGVTNPGSSALTEAVPTSVVATPLTLPTAALHNVLLLGQATVDCTGCQVPVAVSYWLSKGGAAVSSPLSATVDSTDADIVLPISLINQASGDGTFELVVRATGLGTGSAAVRSASLSAIDLGRAF